jgi:hypothetical protein
LVSEDHAISNIFPGLGKQKKVAVAVAAAEYRDIKKKL